MEKHVISTEFIKKLKRQILASRYIVAKLANAEMLRLYYSVGKIVESEFKKNEWGTKVTEEISSRLQQELGGLRGFSSSNIRKMRIFYQEWNKSDIICPTLTDKYENLNKTILPTPTDKFENNDLTAFVSVSFSHHYEIILKTKTEEERWYYINNTAQSFWSVRHLRSELKNKSHLSQINKSNNFQSTLPEELSNKAIRAFKDQYLLDYVNIESADDEFDERVLEHEIVHNIRKFLMSLGNEFSFMGNQFRLIVDGDEYFIDLLFYHRSLQSLVAFELKTGKFKPEYVGKMNFYLSALDDLVKQDHENSSIGIILCKEKDNKKVEYSIRDFSKPMGVSVYKTSETLPPELKNALPDAETLKKLMD
ncbi:MAG: PDDEXK nuclease domain-containing protein [Bacteroidales bacterium]|nr:PDDEXK nuclease domain-containing protein [Bacteroidales bacterium]